MGGWNLCMGWHRHCVCCYSRYVGYCIHCIDYCSRYVDTYYLSLGCCSCCVGRLFLFHYGQNIYKMQQISFFCSENISTEKNQKIPRSTRKICFNNLRRSERACTLSRGWLHPSFQFIKRHAQKCACLLQHLHALLCPLHKLLYLYVDCYSCWPLIFFRFTRKIFLKKSNFLPLLGKYLT